MKPVITAVREVKEHYSHGEERPLRSYAAMIENYGAAVATLGASRRTGRQPERPGVRDTVLWGWPHKLSRLIAKDPLTSPLRALHPVRRHDRPGGARRAGPRARLPTTPGPAVEQRVRENPARR
jgi:hypothetical protein